MTHPSHTESNMPSLVGMCQFMEYHWEGSPSKEEVRTSKRTRRSVVAVFPCCTSMPQYNFPFSGHDQNARSIFTQHISEQKGRTDTLALVLRLARCHEPRTPTNKRNDTEISTQRHQTVSAFNRTFPLQSCQGTKGATKRCHLRGDQGGCKNL